MKAAWRPGRHAARLFASVTTRLCRRAAVPAVPVWVSRGRFLIAWLTAGTFHTNTPAQGALFKNRPPPVHPGGVRVICPRRRLNLGPGGGGSQVVEMGVRAEREKTL